MPTQSASRENWDLYRDLGRAVADRITDPLRHPSFVVYFLLAVLGLGALGVWLEVYILIFPDPPIATQAGQAPVIADSTVKPLRTALITFFTAVAGTSAMQLIWAEDLKHFRSASVLLLFLFLIVAVAIFPGRVPNLLTIPACILMSVLSLLVWCIANAKQADLRDDSDPRAPLGGTDLEAPLSGDTDGWDV